MATYVNDLRLKEIATGDESGTWGTSTNTNLELIGESLGYGTEGITTNADTHTTTVADGSTDPGRAMYIKYTGTLDSACTITIGPNTMSRVHIIENATSGSQNIIIKQGSGAEITIPNGYVKVVYLDGAGSGAAVTEAFDNLSVGTNFRIGNGAAEDTSLVFDGNAQDFYIGLDDSADDLIIGLGSTVGTTPIISVDENKDVAIPDGGLTITTSDNTAQLALVSTDADANIAPLMQFYRNSSSPADNDQIGRIEIYGENDADEKILYGEIVNQIKDASDGSEDGRMAFNVMTAGTAIARMDILPTATVFNEGGYDVDFRVESDANTHAIFLEASSDKLGIGVSSPIARLSLPAQATGDSGIARIAIESAVDDNDFMISQYEDSSGTYTLIGQNLGLNSTGNDTILDGGHRTAAIRLDARGSGSIQFLTGNTNASAEAARFDQSGKLGLGVSPDYKLHIYTSDSGASAHGNADDLFIESSGSTGMTIASGTSSNGSIFFADSGSSIIGQLEYDHANNRMNLIANGNTIIRLSNDGLLFGSDTAAANALNDYEEGTWTAQLSGCDNVNSTGNYVKVGDLVFAAVYSGAFTVANASGTASVTNLPFTAKSGYYGGVSLAHYNGFAAGEVEAYVNAGTSAITFIDQGTVNTTTWVNGFPKYYMVMATYQAA